MGPSTEPPAISGFTINDAPAASFTGPLVVPYAGVKAGTPDRPAALRLEVATSTSGSPVTFRAEGAQLVETLDDSVLIGGPELTVFSQAGTETCTAAVYVFSPVVGQAKVEVQGTTIDTAEFAVVTTREAARDIRLRMTQTSVAAGDDAEATIEVKDAFGNPVENASVDLSLPAKGPGRFATGTNTFTITTDPKGRAAIAIKTLPTGGTLEVRAKGDLASCLPLENQYDCAVNQPVPGFFASSGPQTASVQVTKPSVTVLSPSPGSAYTSGETFTVRAKVVGVKPGALARLAVGGFPVSESTVDETGQIEFPGVVATNGTYQLAVEGLKAVDLDITVKTFGIVSFKRVTTGLKFRVGTGALDAGTLIELTHDGSPVGRIEVSDPGADVYLFAPDASGVYQVQARVHGTTIYGEKPQPVL